MEPVPTAIKIGDAVLVRAEQTKAARLRQARPARRLRESQRVLPATVQQHDQRRRIVVAQAARGVHAIAPGAARAGAEQRCREKSCALCLDFTMAPMTAPEANTRAQPGTEGAQLFEQPGNHAPTLTCADVVLMCARVMQVGRARVRRDRVARAARTRRE